MNRVQDTVENAEQGLILVYLFPDSYDFNISKFEDDIISMRHDGKFDCTICGSVLAQFKIAKTHVKMKHLDPQWFQCTLCGTEIQNRMNFSNHIRRVHQLTGGIRARTEPGIAGNIGVYVLNHS